jgi:diguanylate cyclase (GGDEF)-like protein
MTQPQTELTPEAAAALAHAALRMARSAGLDEMWELGLEAAMNLTRGEAGMILTGGGDAFHCAVERYLDPAFSQACGLALSAAGPELDAALDRGGGPLPAELQALFDRAGWRSSALVELRHGDERVGLLFLVSRPENAFPASVTPGLVALAQLIGSNVGTRRSLEGLIRLSTTDQPTGVLAWRHFRARLQEEVERNRRYGQPFTLLMVDVDRFRFYNDRFGHPAGDSLLQKLGQTFRAHLRAVDLVSRYEGDEFVIMLPETTPELAVIVAERLAYVAEGLGRPGALGTRLTLSAGLIGFPDDGNSVDDLLAAADQAVLAAKELGGDTIFAPSLMAGVAAGGASDAAGETAGDA